MYTFCIFCFVFWVANIGNGIFVHGAVLPSQRFFYVTDAEQLLIYIDLTFNCVFRKQVRHVGLGLCVLCSTNIITTTAMLSFSVLFKKRRNFHKKTSLHHLQLSQFRPLTTRVFVIFNPSSNARFFFLSVSKEALMPKQVLTN
uniref:Putative secreted peptide n=1 Tax=Anopheles braziliensis TaxID=58242 RepID=A0A2M3ZMV0_9DIPT